jgi:UDP-N-acetylglucosamine:LPS N-acetylglucosamine transferase
VDNHQFVNADTLSKAGAAYLLEEKDLETPGSAVEPVRRLFENATEREAMQEAIRKFADRDANRMIWQEIQKLTKYRKK